MPEDLPPDCYMPLQAEIPVAEVREGKIEQLRALGHIVAVKHCPACPVITPAAAIIPGLS